MFKIVTQAVKDWDVVELHGDLDQSGIEVFRAEVEKMLASGKRRYVFDFHDLKFISSEGLNILLWFRFQLNKRGEFRFVLSNASSFLEKIFNITKIDAHFEVVSDRTVFLEREQAVLDNQA
jgi:anti-anti-sigma factor